MKRMIPMSGGKDWPRECRAAEQPLGGGADQPSGSVAFTGMGATCAMGSALLSPSQSDHSFEGTWVTKPKDALHRSSASERRFSDMSSWS